MAGRTARCPACEQAVPLPSWNATPPFSRAGTSAPRFPDERSGGQQATLDVEGVEAREANEEARGRWFLVALILLLFALMLAVVVGWRYGFFTLGPDEVARTQADISELNDRLKDAKRGGFAVKDIDRLPSKLILYEDVAQYQTDNSPDSVASIKALSKMFGARWATLGNQVNWNGDGKPDKRKFVLEGNQALVFYLGGIPYPDAPLSGFSNDPVNLAKRGGNRIGPFFEFDAKRLRREANGFYSYLDLFGTPYAYFAAVADNAYQDTDCAGLGLVPYKTSPKQYVHPDSFQIISAGRDRRFGPGGAVWTPQAGSAEPATRDNLSNFARGLMQDPN
jgi:hypothetical protein